MSDPVFIDCCMAFSGHEIETVKIDGHIIEYGGPGDGFCYGHQSFDCVLTHEQHTRVDEARTDFYAALRSA